jgi:hypothetical protein
VTITRDDVKDLRPGDVVELHRQGWANDVVVRGTLRGDSCVGELYIGDYSIFSENGNEPDWLTFPGTTLTVVYRAPRPLYVNHDRTEPVVGDVVRDAGNETDARTWTRNVRASVSYEWHDNKANVYVPREKLPDRLRLLVDGSTGQVVP